MRTAFPGNLRGESVVLRMFTPADASWIQAACDRPEMARFVPILPSPYTLEDAEGFVAYTRREWEEGTGAPFAIVALDNEPVGSIALHFNSTDVAHAGVGYWLRPEARGRGAATDALKTISGWAFDELHVERLSLITDPENQPSQRVAERAGFAREGLLRAWHPTRAGRRDSVMFSLLAADLASAR